MEGEREEGLVLLEKETAGHSSLLSSLSPTAPQAARAPATAAAYEGEGRRGCAARQCGGKEGAAACARAAAGRERRRETREEAGGRFCLGVSLSLPVSAPARARPLPPPGEPTTPHNARALSLAPADGPLGKTHRRKRPAERPRRPCDARDEPWFESNGCWWWWVRGGFLAVRDSRELGA